jgi:hypothetical protein
MHLLSYQTTHLEQQSQKPTKFLHLTINYANQQYVHFPVPTFPLQLQLGDNPPNVNHYIHNTSHAIPINERLATKTPKAAMPVHFNKINHPHHLLPTVLLPNKASQPHITH